MVAPTACKLECGLHRCYTLDALHVMEGIVCAVQELGTMDNFRVRVLPVLGPIPAMFGDAMAAYVLCSIAQQPLR